jgi:hypothetical protein
MIILQAERTDDHFGSLTFVETLNVGSRVRISLVGGRGARTYDKVFLYLYFRGEEGKLQLVSSALKELRQMSHRAN